jgi:hypothetical protein
MEAGGFEQPGMKTATSNGKTWVATGRSKGSQRKRTFDRLEWDALRMTRQKGQKERPDWTLELSGPPGRGATRHAPEGT